MKAILTGGLGFIGFNFYELYKNEVDFLVIDKKSYASNPLAEKAIQNLKIMDVGDPEMETVVLEFQPDVIFHFAAESHVDRSILDPTLFLRSNVLGTTHLLEVVRKYQDNYPHRRVRFVNVSTDEVYGSLGAEGQFRETTPLAPNSPYSSSKASADMFARAYHKTFGLDVVTTRCSNNYGPWQFPEKLIPLMIINAMEGKTLPVYGDGSNVRDWIFVDDHCRGVMEAGLRGKSGEVYNFGGLNEWQNLKIVEKLLDLIDRPKSLIRFVEDRKGHDFRYAMNCDKAIAELQWKPSVTFEEGLETTVRWNLENKDWLDFIRSDRYKEYYQTNYGTRMGAST